jgi:hypothetical protein
VGHRRGSEGSHPTQPAQGPSTGGRPVWNQTKLARVHGLHVVDAEVQQEYGIAAFHCQQHLPASLGWLQCRCAAQTCPEHGGGTAGRGAMAVRWHTLRTWASSQAKTLTNGTPCRPTTCCLDALRWLCCRLTDQGREHWLMCGEPGCKGSLCFCAAGSFFALVPECLSFGPTVEDRNQMCRDQHINFELRAGGCRRRVASLHSFTCTNEP